MTPELRVAVGVVKFSCSPADVSKVLNLKPTKTWVIGEAVPQTSLLRKHNAWFLESASTAADSLESQAAWLVGRLPAGLEKLRTECGPFEAVLSCAVYVADETPALQLRPDTLRRLAELGAALDIDLYVVTAADDV